MAPEWIDALAASFSTVATLASGIVLSRLRARDRKEAETERRHEAEKAILRERISDLEAILDEHYRNEGKKPHR